MWKVIFFGLPFSVGASRLPQQRDLCWTKEWKALKMTFYVYTSYQDFTLHGFPVRIYSRPRICTLNKVKPHSIQVGFKLPLNRCSACQMTCRADGMRSLFAAVRSFTISFSCKVEGKRHTCHHHEILWVHFPNSSK